jgi:hypothetical protein
MYLIDIQPFTSSAVLFSPVNSSIGIQIKWQLCFPNWRMPFHPVLRKQWIRAQMARAAAVDPLLLHGRIWQRAEWATAAKE